MKPEDVPGEWVDAAQDAYKAVTSGSALRAIIAAVAPLIAKAEREACAKVVEEAQAEVQANIDANIDEVRMVQIKPSDNRPLIRARDWLRHTAAAIRAR